MEVDFMEVQYRALLAYCGIEYEVGGEERLRKLRYVSAEKLIEAIDGLGITQFNSLRDEGFYTRGFPTWWTQDEMIGSCEWVDKVMIGDAFLEVCSHFLIYIPHCYEFRS